MIDRILAAAVLAAILACAAAPADEFVDWRRRHDKAERKAWDAGLLEKGLDGLSAADRYVMGVAALNARDTAAAETCFRSILEETPGHPAATWGLAEVLHRRQRDEAADALLAKVLEKAPHFAPALVTRARIRFVAGRFEECLRWAEQVVARGREKTDDGSAMRALLLVGAARGMLAHEGGWLARVRHGRHVKRCIDEAAAIRPDAPEVLIARGGFLATAPDWAGGDMDGARTYFRRAVEVAPDMAEAHVRLAAALLAEGDREGYRRHLEKAVELNPDDPMVLDVTSGRCRFIAVKTPAAD